MKKVLFCLISLAIASIKANASVCYYADGRPAAAVQASVRGVQLLSQFGHVPPGFYGAGPYMSATSADVRAFYDNSYMESAILVLQVGNPGRMDIITREDSSPAYLKNSTNVYCK